MHAHKLHQPHAYAGHLQIEHPFKLYIQLSDRESTLCNGQICCIKLALCDSKKTKLNLQGVSLLRSLISCTIIIVMYYWQYLNVYTWFQVCQWLTQLLWREITLVRVHYYTGMMMY